MRRRDMLLTPAAALAAAAPARATASMKTLRVAFPIAETGFDPAQVQDLYSRTVIGHILDAPLEFDYMARPARLRVSTLVAMPDVSADLRTFTFRLRPGILFQDDAAFGGQPRELVAADYVYSWKRIYDPRWKSPMLFVLENSKVLGLTEMRAAALRSKRPFDYDIPVEGLQVLDRYAFRVRLAEPNPRMIYNFADASLFGAIAREVVEAYGDDIMAHPVGTGPFRLAAWTRSSRIVLERNPTYRDERYDVVVGPEAPALAVEASRLQGRRLPLVDRVEIAIIEESQPRWLAFLQGQLDILNPVPVDLTRVAAPNGRLAPFLERKRVKGTFTPMSDVMLSYFNMEHPLIGGYTAEKVALRRAIALGFDGRQYIRHIFSGFGVPAESPFCPGTWGYDPAFRTPMSEYNPARARALLDTYGYVDRNGDGWRETPQGAALTLEIASTSTQRDRSQNELWTKFMNALNLRTSFRIAQWPELVKQSTAGQLMIWGYGWQLGQPDSDTMFGMAYGGNMESINDARFDLKVYNRLFEQQRVLPDGPERLSLLHEASRLLAAYMPYLLHMHSVYVDLCQPWVMSYRRHPFTSRIWACVDVADERQELGRA
ncbi:MAG TPA: ABC transporter substrate-binding protein [Burkholderiaceae bacterium]|nr:ABC transporter substrate-binding protein [Burkholderiaceae bacterium]HQR72699.1 ABC transporter substrate-binding protein [Burkholderiaceae bacterium]